LKNQVKSMQQGLDSIIDYNKKDGFKFSDGSRQLFGLARAFLKKSKILLIDEVTSNVDNK
jgi:ABC-type multidrug transport system fused ATPase/permease subunit